MHGRTLLGLGLAAILAAPAAAAERCSLPGAKTLARTKQARVFSVPGKGAIRRRYYGCRTGHRPIRLAYDLVPAAADETRTTNATFRLGGSWVAWQYTSASDFGAGEFATGIAVRSLAGSRRRIRQDISRYGLKNLTVAANGDVAWVLSSGRYREVDAVEHTTTIPTPLAVVPGVDSESLRVRGGNVTFAVNGESRTVALAAPAPFPDSSAVGPQALDGRFGDCGTLVPARPRANVFTAATQLARAPGGALVSAGTATSGEGDPLRQDELVVARFATSGRFDSTFGSEGVVVLPAPWPGAVESVHVTGLVVGPDGRVVVAAYVIPGNATDARVVLVRLNADGTLDPSFGSGGVARDVVPAARSADVRDLVLGGDGTLLIAGERDDLYYLARFTSTGAHDPAFGTGGIVSDPGEAESGLHSLALQPDGTIFAGGGTDGQPLLLRFDPSGTLLSANTAGPPATGRLLALEPTAAGGVEAVGAAANVNNPDQVLLARYGADGKPDSSLGQDGFALDPQISAPSDLALDADGGAYVTGSFFLRPGSYGGNGLKRYTAAGTRDTAFGLRGALGGTSSYGLVNYDVLLGDGGTAYVAQDNGGAYGVSRFAIAQPATGAASARSSVCAMATTTKIKPLIVNRRLDVSLRLRAPGRLHLEIRVTASGRTLRGGTADVLRPFTEGAIASIPLSKAAVRLLRSAKSALIVVTAGAPARARTTYRTTLTR
jgi:uncharacterized delta-60 repeat protein